MPLKKYPSLVSKLSQNSVIQSTFFLLGLLDLWTTKSLVTGSTYYNISVSEIMQIIRTQKLCAICGQPNSLSLCLLFCNRKNFNYFLDFSVTVYNFYFYFQENQCTGKKIIEHAEYKPGYFLLPSAYKVCY